MKTTSIYYSEKEKNLAIYNELAKVAADIFEKYIICEPGQYTAADIAKELTFDRETVRENKKDFDGVYRNIENVVIKNRRFKSLKFQFKQDYEPENDRREITIETFSCRVDGFSVFDVLKKAGAAWAVPTSKKAVFVREPESAAAVAGFDVPAATVAKQLKNSVAVDKLRPVMNYIYFDVARRCLVSSDGYLMTVTAAPAVTIESPDTAADGYLISSQLFKKGRIIIDSNNMITNNGAAAVAGEGRFPNWFGIIPEHNESQAVNVGGHWPEIKKAVAKLAKFTDLQNSPVVLRGESYNNKIYLCTVNYEGQQQHDTIVLDENINFDFVIGVNGENVAKIEKAEKLYFTDPSRAVSFVASGVYTLAMPVLLDDNYFDFLKNRWFKAPTTGARVDVLKGIICEPQDTNETAAPVAIVADDIESQDTNETNERKKSLKDFHEQIKRIENICDTWRPVRRDKNGETVVICKCPYHYSLPVIRGNVERYYLNLDRVNFARKLYAIYRENIAKFTGSDVIDINEKFSRDVYSPATTNESEPQDTNETTAAPAAVVPEVATAADDDTAATTNESEPESESEPAAVVPCTVADDVRENMYVYATIYLHKQKYNDNEIYAAARALKKSGFLPVGDYFETLHGVRVAKIAKKYDFKTGRVLSVAVEFLTIETSEPESAAPVADDIESQDTNETTAAPAAVVPEVATAADIETESEPAPVAIVASAADDIESQDTNETTAAPAAVVPEVAATTTNESEPESESEPAAVLAVNFAARARRWFAVAAAVLALFIVGATTTNESAAPSLPVLTPQDTARAIVADDIESEPQDTAAAAPVLTPQDTNESATTTAKASHRTPRRARRAAKFAPVAIVASADTLTADTARAIVADDIERQDTAAVVPEVATADTLTTDTTTAAPVAIVADDIESQDTTNDDAPAVAVADGDESEPATVADDDTNDDDESEPESETSTTGTTTTGNGGTTGTTTTTTASVVIVGASSVPVWLLTL